MNDATCTCPGRIDVREQPDWNGGRPLYGYGVAVTVRVHTGACPKADEVLQASAWPVTP